MKRFLLLAVLAGLTVGCNSGAKSSDDGGMLNVPKVVATVNGEKITRDELQEVASGELSKLSAQVYQIHKMALDGLIGEKLVIAAAKKENLEAEEYVKQQVDNNLVEVDDETAKRFYEQNKAQMGGAAFAQVKPRIKDYLNESQRRQLEGQLATKLKTGADIKTFIEPPRTKVAEAKDAPTRGPANAKVTIIEFSDYQCPFCQRARSTVEKVLETYGDKVRYVLRDFPLSFHKEAFKAHEAAYCAGDQNKYWEMSELLFKNQKDLEVAKLKGYAKDLSLDMAKFDKCLDEDVYKERVQQGLVDGQSAGVSGTPAFFVNGIQLSGARPFSDFKKIIDEEIDG